MAFNEYLEIGNVPSGENCVQVSDKHDYMPAMRAETQKYKEMLLKRFPNCDLIELSIKSCPHDFGSYLDIRVKFDDNNDKSISQAYFIEANLPEKWSDNEVLTWVADVED
jgi:D-alanine-D-alanine ligase-like ATP-grasp enzyme